MSSNMKTMELKWKDIRKILKVFIRTVKPWRITAYRKWESGTFNEGWNACLKEMRNNELKWFKKMDKDSVEWK